VPALCITDAVTAWASLCSAPPYKVTTTKKREAERRQTRNPTVRASGRGARPAGRARLSAFHCGSCVGDRTAPLRPGDALPVTGFRPSQYSELLADRSSCRPGVFTEAAPARTANPRGSTALAPLPKVPSRRRPSMSEILWLVSDLGTDVKQYVTDAGTTAPHRRIGLSYAVIGSRYVSRAVLKNRSAFSPALIEAVSR
jgi:hypothetical protein